MGKRYGSSKVQASHHRSPDENKSKLRRSAASLQLATPAATAVSHGAAHSVDFQEAQKYHKAVAFVALAGYLFAFLCMLPTTKAGFAADRTVDTRVPQRSGVTVGVSDSTPAVSTTQHATTTAPAARVGAAGGTGLSAFKPPSSTAGPSTIPVTTVHKEASDFDDLPLLSTKEEAIMYLNNVKQCLAEMTDDARELTAPAYYELADSKRAEDTPAAQIIALHEFCGSLLDSYSDIPQRLTAQAEALKKFVRVFESIRQYIEDVREDFHSTTASYKADTKAVILEMRSLDDKIDKWMEPTQRILLGEAAFALALLAEQHVFGSQGSGYEHHLTLNQLHSMYKARLLDTRQARRWEQVMSFVERQINMKELLIVDSELRKARYGDAHGTDEEKQDTRLEDLIEYAARLYSREQHPDLHGPLQTMLTVLAEFSSKNTPCVPDSTFASKMHPSLLQKLFS
ncbi:g1559 [Coccomyxa elongata]